MDEIPAAPGPAAEPSLVVDRLVVRRGGRKVVGPLSLTVGEGEIVALVGANGAGKTSLVESVAGLVRTKTGSIRHRGTEIGKLRAERVVREGVALVPEGRQLFLDQTVEDNLLLGCYRRARDKDYVAGGLEDAFARFPVLKEKRRHTAATLSGGEQQMLALARALMSRPHLLILDEPSTGLAPLIVKRFMEALEELRKEGLATLLVEQLVETALATADRAYVLSRGTIVAEGSTNEVAQSPELVSAYVGAVVRRD